MLKPALLFASFAIATACATPGREAVAAPAVPADALASHRAAFMDAYARADADAVAAFYAPDATYIGTGGDIVTGREKLLNGLRREVPAFRGFQAEPTQFEADGRFAWERGVYRAVLTIPGRPPQPVSGPYLIVYERDPAGRWLIKAHMSGRHR